MENPMKISHLVFIPTFCLLTVVHAADKSYVNAPSGLNVRTGPGTQFDIATSIDCSESVEILETKGEWAKIEFMVSDKVIEGWVASRYLSETYPDCPQDGGTQTVSGKSSKKERDSRTSLIEEDNGQAWNEATHSAQIELCKGLVRRWREKTGKDIPPDYLHTCISKVFETEDSMLLGFTIAFASGPCLSSY
jgi:uncharacterized protein YraI